MISYAGVDLSQPPPGLPEWVDANVCPDDVRTFDGRSWPGPGLVGLDGGPDWPDRPLRLSRLVWPTGASRFAYFHGLADQPQVDAIRAKVYAAGYAAQYLVMADGTATIAPLMWMLPPRPLQQTGADGFYLLTLVDDRYFWWQKAAALTVVGGTTTWTQLFAQIAAALGITLTVDAVSSSYGKPSTTLGADYEALPLLLDAAAVSVGRRVVRQMDGSVRLWSPENSRRKTADQLAALVPARDKQAGGVFSLGV